MFWPRHWVRITVGLHLIPYNPQKAEVNPRPRPPALSASPPHKHKCADSLMNMTVDIHSHDRWIHSHDEHDIDLDAHLQCTIVVKV